MELKTFVSKSISDIVSGIDEANKTITDAKSGYVWTNNLITSQENLVELGFAKWDSGDSGKSKPILVLRYDLNIAVEVESGSADKAAVGVNAKF